MKARVAVLLSGRGSNYVALQEAVECGDIPAEIVVVLSNRSDAQGLNRATSFGVEALAVPHEEAPSREDHEERLLATLAERQIEWVCLAGYMRLLSGSFVASYPNRILNIHPSLLPAFPGLGAQVQALEHGVKVSGCTVHLVDAGLDSGPIVVQRPVPVRDSDTVESLSGRILEQEHLAYPEALGKLLRSSWRVEGRRIRFGPESA